MRRNWVEWLALAISVAAILGVVGFLVADGITDADRPPEPRVALQPDAAYETSTGWIVPATVTNGGDVPAVALALRAAATVEGSEEESEVTIDYLPPGTDVEVSFGFSAEPDGEVSVTTVGFRLP
jgi:uncharacterized protein (TIGR02588 family)